MSATRAPLDGRSGEGGDPARPLATGAPGSPAPRRRRRRLLRLLAIAIGVLAFLAISGWLARYLSNENNERDQIVALLQAQQAGDLPGMLAKLPGCRLRPGCDSAAAADAEEEHDAGGGAIKILALSSPTAYALTDTEGLTRVAWKAAGRLPVVQCVVVRRSGSPLTGLSVRLREIGRPIADVSNCHWSWMPEDGLRR